MKQTILSTLQRLGIKGVSIIAACLLVIIVLLQNMDTVTVDILFWEAVVLAKPFFILLCVAAGLIPGFIAGWLFGKSGSGLPDQKDQF